MKLAWGQKKQFISEPTESGNRGSSEWWIGMQTKLKCGGRKIYKDKPCLQYRLGIPRRNSFTQLVQNLYKCASYASHCMSEIRSGLLSSVRDASRSSVLLRNRILRWDGAKHLHSDQGMRRSSLSRVIYEKAEVSLISRFWSKMPRLNAGEGSEMYGCVIVQEASRETYRLARSVIICLVLLTANASDEPNLK